jgi:hypothetical protein
VDPVFLHELPTHLHGDSALLRIASWIAIGAGGAALVLSWGRILAWLRSDESRPETRLATWGADQDGWFAELHHAPEGVAWTAEMPGGILCEPTVTRGGRSTWLRLDLPDPPLRLLSADGTQFDIPS